MKKRVFSFIMMIFMILSTINVGATKATAKTKHITIKKFVELTMKESGIGKTYKDAIKSGVVLENEFEDTSEHITNEDVALILDRTWSVLHGDTDNDKTKTKGWYLRPSFIFQIDVKSYLYEDPVINKTYKIPIEDIFFKPKKLVSMFQEKYPQYEFVLSKDYVSKKTINSCGIKSNETKWNIDDLEVREVEYRDYDIEKLLSFGFSIKDKCYHDKEYKKMIEDIKKTHNVYLDVDNSQYYKLNLTYSNIKESIMSNNRISDIKKVKPLNIDAEYSMYSKGVMTGYSNGSYKANRSFKPTEKSTETEVKVWISRVVGKTPLRKFTPEGMLIRETNLPFNHKEWKYILEDVPNEFYKMRYSYEILLSTKDLNIVRDEAILPSELNNEYYKWDGIEGNRLEHLVEYVGKSLEKQLNISYKTIDESWKDEYWDILGEINDIGNMERRSEYRDEEGKVTKTVITDSKTVFDRYIEFVKKNKITVKSANIFVDPYGIYIGEEDAFIRCYAKFKVNWSGNIQEVDSLVFPGFYYSSNMSRNNLDGLKKDKYIECLVDVPVDLRVPFEYQRSKSYLYAPTGYLKSMKYLTNPDPYYGLVYIKEKQLKIIKYLADPKWDIWHWKWEGMKLY